MIHNHNPDLTSVQRPTTCLWFCLCIYFNRIIHASILVMPKSAEFSRTLRYADMPNVLRFQHTPAFPLRFGITLTVSLLLLAALFELLAHLLPAPSLIILDPEPILRCIIWCAVSIALLLTLPVRYQPIATVVLLIASTLLVQLNPHNDFPRLSTPLVSVWLGILLPVFAITPARAPLTAQTVRIARLSWLLIVPSLTLLATLPVVREFVENRPDFFGQFVFMDIRRPDWLAHFIITLLVTGLLVLSAPLGRLRPRFSAAGTLVVMVLTAPFIEFVQSFTGRNVEVNDVWHHFLGMLVACLIWFPIRSWHAYAQP